MVTMRFHGGLMGACLATVLGAGCDPESSDGECDLGTDSWGYAKIQFLRAGNQDGSPFIGTDSIRARLSYDSCVAGFYRANPDWRDDGIEGGPIFEEWKNRVCEAQDECGWVLCDSANSWQSGLESEDEVASLNLEYQITEGKDEEIEHRVLIVGPLLTAELADCDGGALPTVSIQAPNVTGHDSDGNPIWIGTSAPEYKATTNQGLPMKVRVARL
jgi:hypothetical protein